MRLFPVFRRWLKLSMAKRWLRFPGDLWTMQLAINNHAAVSNSGLRRWAQNPVLQFTLATLGVAISTILRLWLGREFGMTPTLVEYMPVLLVVSFWASTTTGLWTTLLSAAAGDYFFMEPTGSLAIARLGDRIGLGLFVLVGLAINLLARSLRDRTIQMLKTEEELWQAEQRRMEERAQAEEARLRLAELVDSSDDAIIGKDVHGIVTSWNHGAEMTFGYDAKEMIGQSIRRLLPSDRLSEEEVILVLIMRGETIKHYETLRLTKDHREIDVSLTISPVRDTQGHVVGASKIARDITSRKSLERQLHESMKMEAVGQLTGGIAHDFNNLLGIVLGNLEMLDDQLAGDEAARSRVQIAYKAAKRGADLTRRLLTFSTNEQLLPEATPLAEAIENVVTLASRTLGPDIEIQSDVEAGMHCVYVDPAGLESALLNLAVNARDAMPHGGSLMISASSCELEPGSAMVQSEGLTPGRYARLEVADTGCGMSEETLARAFEPFFTTKPRDRGTGLGLAMVYGFVKHSKGAIRIASEEHKGTAVSFYLPFAQVIDESKRMDRPPEISEARAAATVLLVDDETALLEVAATFLEQRGYRTLLATDGAGGVQLVERHPEIDVMITDILMPGGMKGTELAQRARKLRPDLKVVYMSGYTSVLAGAAQQHSLDGPLLKKPFRLADLQAMIEAAMRDSQESEGWRPTAAMSSASERSAGVAPGHAGN